MKYEDAKYIYENNLRPKFNNLHGSLFAAVQLSLVMPTTIIDGL